MPSVERGVKHLEEPAGRVQPVGQEMWLGVGVSDGAALRVAVPVPVIEKVMDDVPLAVTVPVIEEVTVAVPLVVGTAVTETWVGEEVAEIDGV